MENEPLLNLEDTRILRGGVTSSQMVIETESCSAAVDESSGTLTLRFQIASKGGGTTRIRVRIGRSDICRIIQAVADGMPSAAVAITEAAALAARRLEETAMKYESDAQSEKTKTQAALEGLEAVAEDLESISSSVSSAKKEPVTLALTRLQKVMWRLRFPDY
jgi:hypothetical protein